MMSSAHKSLSKLVVVGVVLGLSAAAATQAASMSPAQLLTPNLGVVAAARQDVAEQGWLSRLTDLWKQIWGQPGAPGDLAAGRAHNGARTQSRTSAFRPTNTPPPVLPITQPCGAGGGGDESSGPWP